jgi:lipopolysaccharide export LptBFGC system permease protein LptF
VLQAFLQTSYFLALMVKVAVMCLYVLALVWIINNVVLVNGVVVRDVDVWCNQQISSWC